MKKVLKNIVKGTFSPLGLASIGIESDLLHKPVADGTYRKYLLNNLSKEDQKKLKNLKTFKDFSEEMMTTQSTAGKPGFSSTADAAGPVSGRDPLMFAKPIKRKPKDIKSDWISYLTRRSYKKTLG